MEFITWKDSFSVKVPTIDEQHGKLVKILNELYKQIYKKISDDFLRELLTELEDYTKYHFDYEEDLMNKYGFSEFNEHKEAHEYFKEQIAHYKESLSADDTDELVEFATFLKNWLLKHIMGADKKYSSLLVKNNVK